MYLNEKKELVFGDPEDRKHAIGIGQSRKAAYKELAEKIDSGEIRAVGAHATRLSHLPSQLRTEAPKPSQKLTGRSVDSLRAQLLAETTDEELREGFELTREEGARFRVITEQRQYGLHDDPDRTGTQFLLDVARATLYNEPNARARLGRHMAEEEVERGDQVLKQQQQRAAGDTTTTNWAGLLAPGYLLTPELQNASRPLAEICRHFPLPPYGVAVEVGGFTTDASATLMGAELPANVAAVSSNFGANAVPVQTVSGMQQLSLQVVDRANIRDTLFQDMVGSYNVALDSSLYTTATTGLFAAATQVAFTNASPTAALLLPLLGQGLSKATAAFKGKGKADTVLMHDRRFEWFATNLGTTFSLVTSSADQVSTDGSTTVGRLPSGHKIVSDPNVPVNVTAGALGGGTEDLAFCVNSQECLLFEQVGSPLFVSCEPAGKLNVVFTVRGYFAFFCQRYGSGSVQVVTGTGMLPVAGY